MRVIEFRVIVTTSDERAGVADRIEAEVRRHLNLPFGPDHVYVEQTLPRHYVLGREGVA